MPSEQERALSQPDFYIDPTNGNDSRSGETVETAIKTYAEYARRVGDGVVNLYQVLHLLDDLDEDIIIRGSHPHGMEIYGERSVIYSGTVSSAQAWNTASSPVADGRIGDSGMSGTWSTSGPGSTSLIGKMLVMTSGANAGKVTHVLKDLGSKTARIGQLVDPLTFATGTPAVGDSFDVVDLTEVRGRLIMQSDDVAGLGYAGLYDVELIASGSPIVGRRGALDLAWDVIRQTDSIAYSLTCDFSATGVRFGSYMLAEAMAGAFGYFACCFLDARTRLYQSRAVAGLLNVQQAVSGGVLGNGPFVTLDISDFSLTGDFVGADIATGSQAIVRVERFSSLTPLAGGRLSGLGLTAGAGVFVDSYALSCWPAGGSCASYYNIDVSGSAVEFRLGGTDTDAAALGTSGSIITGNGAAAVPLTN